MKYEDITGRIIGAAFEVHKILGCGFQEVIYQRALALEMRNRNLSFDRELEHDVVYKEHTIGSRRIDFVVNEKVIVELKATAVLDDAHVAQTLNYLKLYHQEVGLLINFGSKSLTFKRLILTNQQP